MFPPSDGAAQVEAVATMDPEELDVKPYIVPTMVDDVNMPIAQPRHRTDAHRLFAWALANVFYQHGYVAGSQRFPQPRYHDVCLTKALRALGAKVRFVGDGPHWALADGNK